MVVRSFEQRAVMQTDLMAVCRKTQLGILRENL